MALHKFKGGTRKRQDSLLLLPNPLKKEASDSSEMLVPTYQIVQGHYFT